MNTLLRETLLFGHGFQIIAGDITKDSTEAIVNPANSALQHGGGLARVISNLGGSTIQKESDEWVRKYGPVSHNSPAYTSAGNLPFRYVIHAVGPLWSNHPDDPVHLAQAIFGALALADQLQLASLSLPAIATGIFGYPKGKAARVIFEEVSRFFQENPQSGLTNIRLVLFDQPTQKAFLEEWDKQPG